MLPPRHRLSPAPLTRSARSSPKAADVPVMNRRPSASPKAGVRLNTDPSPHLMLPPLSKNPRGGERRNSLRPPSEYSPNTSPQSAKQPSFSLQVPTNIPYSSQRTRRGSTDRSPTPEPYPSKVAAMACLSKEGKLHSVPKIHNQDAYLTVEKLLGRPDSYMFGVFDGHGTYGHDVSQYLRDHMAECFTKSLRTTDMSNPELVIDALKDGFRAVNAGVRKGTLDSVHSGSTCVVLLVIGDICICGNVGDSRAILIRERHGSWFPIPLSQDHKPTVEDERARIIERGGVIAQQTNSAGISSGPLRVWLPGQQQPGLAMTRSMGDVIASKIGVIGDPEVQQVVLTSQDQGILLASDGLWEVLSNEEVADLLNRYQDNSPGFALEKLMEEAQSRWQRMGSTVDDTTFVYIRLVTSSSPVM